MPKIYFKSKDVEGVDVLQWKGECYSRTGVYATPSNSSNIPLSAVTLFYGDCNTCDGGQKTVTAGTQTTILSTESKFQLMVGDLNPGEQAGLEFNTCVVVLSANSLKQLVFDVAGAGNGPHTFTYTGETFTFEDCNTPPVTYDVTLAGLGSYYLTFENKSFVSDDDTGTDTTTTTAASGDQELEVQSEYDMELSELSDEEQIELQATTSDVVAEETGVDEANVVTTLEEGSIIATTIIKNLTEEKVDQVQDSLDTNTLTEKLSARISKAHKIRQINKAKLVKARRVSRALRRKLVKNDYTIGLTTQGNLCYSALSGKDLAGSFKHSLRYCNPSIYMQDDETITLKITQQSDMVFDMFDRTGEPLRGETTHYSVTGLPLTGNGEVTLSLVPGFSGHIDYRETTEALTGNPGLHPWSVPPGGAGKILVKKTTRDETKPVLYRPTIHTRGFFKGAKVDSLDENFTREQLSRTVTSAVTAMYPVNLGPVKTFTGMKQTAEGVVTYTVTTAPFNVNQFAFNLVANAINNPTEGGATVKSNLWQTLCADFLPGPLPDFIKGTESIANFRARVVRPPIVCAQDVKTCWDDSTVSRDPDNKCQFRACPPFPITLTTGKSARYVFVPQDTSGYVVTDLDRKKKALGLNAPIHHVDIHDTLYLKNVAEPNHPLDVELKDPTTDQKILFDKALEHDWFDITDADARATVEFKLDPAVIYDENRTEFAGIRNRLKEGKYIVAHYYCTAHPQSMRGPIYIVDRRFVNKK